MPRYYFHVRDDIDVDDEEGAVLSDEIAARTKAVEGARELMCETLKAGYIDLNHYILVTDDAGEVLFKLAFRDVVQVRD